MTMQATPAPPVAPHDTAEEFEVEAPYGNVLAPVSGLLRSPQCDYTLHVEAEAMPLEVIYRKAIHYAFMVSVVSSIQCLLTPQQIEHTNTPSRAAKVSPYTMALQAVMDAYLCLAHLGIGLAAHQVLFDSYAVVCFLKFLLW